MSGKNSLVTADNKKVDVVVNNDIEYQAQIENLILNIRGVQVMLDRDLARLYGVSTSRLNEQVKRNIERFPASFRFQLKETERDELVAICDNLKTLKFTPTLPYVFTEQGIAQLSSVLHTPTAIKVSVMIMNHCSCSLILKSIIPNIPQLN